ncbi:MAG: hypothetical protein HZB61_13565 [Nitrospirae bacterium]|nr:hypothetical protein [Nitrospirota bacterium]
MVPRSIRRDMNTLEMSISSEVFLCRLFGHSMWNIHGIRSQKTWKKIQKRIYDILKKAIELNVNSDIFHKSRLDSYLGQFERACDSKENTDIDIIFSLTAIILELLGGVPDYTSRKALNRHSDYLLSGLRSIQYYQTPYQKMRTIIEAAHFKPYCDYHKSDDLYDVYVSEYNGNSIGFLNWYRKKYPNVYSELF